MTTTSVSGASQDPVTIHPSKLHPAKKETESAKPALGTTVVISAAAQAAQEAAETPAQTAQEARGNDRQAQKLLAKEEAAIKAYSAK